MRERGESFHYSSLSRGPVGRLNVSSRSKAR
jgi:hypothetical protein